MKKILLVITISLLSLTTAYAGSFQVGVQGGIMEIKGKGTETDIAGTADTSVRSKEVSHETFSGSIFAEYSLDSFSYSSDGNGLTIGIGHMPGSADVSASSFKRTDTELSKTDVATVTANIVNRSAQAEIENVMNYYVEVPVYGMFYGKIGYTEMDVNTLETGDSSISSTYGNTTVSGTNLGFGAKGNFTGGLGWKVAYEIQDFDTLSISSSQTDKGNRVEADLDTTHLNFSLGYKF